MGLDDEEILDIMMKTQISSPHEDVPSFDKYSQPIQECLQDILHKNLDDRDFTQSKLEQVLEKVSGLLMKSEIASDSFLGNFSFLFFTIIQKLKVEEEELTM